MDRDLEHLAYLLRLAAMTAREIAAGRESERQAIFELADIAEDVGDRLETLVRTKDLDWDAVPGKRHPIGVSVDGKRLRST